MYKKTINLLVPTLLLFIPFNTVAFESDVTVNDAARKGDVPLVEKLLIQGYKPDKPNRLGFVALSGAEDNWGCDVYILQDANGKVQSVNVQSCNIDDSAKTKSFKNSIERAVYKASPLPTAPDASVFDREILFHFRVN
jgi:hypothetical protein